MEITKQLAQFLDNRGFGEFFENGTSGNIFINTLPAEPDEVIGIFSTGGPAHDQKNEYGRVSIQVLIRSVPYNAMKAEQTVQDIIDSLNGFNSDYLALDPLTNEGNLIFDITAEQNGPNNIGHDENGRIEFSQNFMIEYVK